MSAGHRWFPVNYGHCLTAYLGPSGLRLSVWPILRIKHPPLLIPWEEISSIKTKKGIFTVRYNVLIGKTRTTLYFQGKLGNAIQVAWLALTRPTQS